MAQASDLLWLKSIMDLHGGSAKIESEIGRGATVSLSFPLQ
jgi:signal transduction histidine kinase